MTKVILSDSHAIQNFGINLFIFDINQVHLFTNALHGSFGTEGSNISSDKSMGLAGDSLGIDIFIKLHVASMDTEDFKTTILIRHTDINFTIKSTETTKCWINGIGTIRSSNHNDRSTLLESVHEGQHLRDNTAFDFSVGLFPLGSDGINFINKDNGRCVLFCFFKGLAKVGFGFSGHFGHDLGTVDEEEKGTGFIRDSTSNKGFTRPRRSIEKNSTGRLDS